MWPTLSGTRMLRGAEADLVRGAICTMVDHLVLEFNDDSEPWHYGIDLFDSWDSDQRLWLLEHVSVALLTDADPLPAAAIWEATADAIFCEVVDLIAMEIDHPGESGCDSSWRQSVIDAFTAQHARRPEITCDESDFERWRCLVAQIADTILGPTSYLKLEAFRDGDFQRLQEVMQQRALPADYLDLIPPLRSVQQTQQSIDRLVSLH